MNILFVTGEYPPMSGGVGAYTAELAGALSRQGVNCHVLTSVEARDGAAAIPVTVTVHPVVDGWGWSIRRTVAQLAAQVEADWIHVQYQTAAFHMNPSINLAPARWRSNRRRVAWTYHDLLMPYLFPKAGGRLRRWVTERPARTSALTIVTNQGDRGQLQARGVDPIRAIPIGSNIRGQSLSPAERAARRRLRGYTDMDRVLGYFGFLNRSKGGLTLVTALQRLSTTHPTVKLLMIGERVGASDPTNFAYLQEVEALAAELGVADRIQWTGHQSDAAVGADLNACDVLVMPYEDGASLRRGTLMAGLANGCAVVTTTPQAPLPELVTERDLIYVAPGNAQALARMTARLMDNPWLLDRLRTNARDRAQLFSWESIAAAHLDAYRAFGVVNRG